MDERHSQDAKPATPKAIAPATNAAPSGGLAFDPRDLIPTPIFCASTDGRVVWMNAAAEALVGQTASSLSGKSFAELFPTEVRRRLARQFVRHHRNSERDFYVEAPVATDSEESHWVGMQIRLVTASNGKSAYLCSAHDLSEIHAELDGLRRRERELNARLDEANAGAELKSEFLASMSHQLRAPMNGVIGMSRLLLDSNLDRDQRTFAEVIAGSGEQLLELVDDILDYSRIEAGQLEIGRMDFDVRVTVDAVAGLLSEGARARGITFSSWVHHRVPSRLNGDPGRFRQVVVNLAQNALRCGEGGELQLRLELVEETAHQAVVRVWVNRVWSNGAPAESIAGEFESFASTPTGNGAVPGGATALGLAIGRRIVHLMGGDTGVSDVPGMGTRMWFRVPFGKQAEIAEPAPSESPNVGLSGVRVLIADPTEVSRKILAETLSSWGVVCEEATGGLETLERMKKAAATGRAYAIVIADMELPELDSRDLAAAIKADASLASTGLLLLTSVGRPGDAARAAEWGYGAYFVTPIDDDQLKGAIGELLVRRDADRAQGAETGERPIVTRFLLAEQKRSRVRVLVVEDNPLDQLVVLSALRRVGYAPEAVTSGELALESIARQPFDIIFMDVMMDGIDGCETAQRIRQSEAKSGAARTPIVALTGRVRAEERERCTASGMDDFLAKPIDLELMCATVEKWMSKDAPAAPAGEPDAEQVTIAMPRPAGITPPAPAAVEESEPPVAPEREPVVAAEPEPEPAPVVAAEPGPVVAAKPEPTSTDAVAEIVPVSENTWDEWTSLGDEDEAPAAPSAPAAAPVAEPAAPEVTEAWVAKEDSKDESGDDIEALPILDAARIETSSMGNPELRAMLVDAFLARTQQPLERLRVAGEAKDARAIEIQAHSLKGLCGAVGAMRAAALFDRIETKAGDGDVEAACSWISRATVETKLAMDGLEPKAEAA